MKFKLHEISVGVFMQAETGYGLVTVLGLQTYLLFVL